MKTYIYQDEKSHKFWAVEQQENELHISWGKVGTNGQSQIKSFADAAAAEKAELKLIAEKTKKGYAEEVSVTTPTSAPVQVIACSEKAPLPQDKPPFAEDHLPWLADDAQIILPTEVAPTTLSHRRWPGDSVPQENELTLLRSVAAHTHRRFKKVITFDYSTCSLDWQQAITQAVGLIDSPISTALPPMVLAVLVALEQGFNRNDHEELMDQIVQEGGLEYATEVVIALQAIRFDWNYDAHLITFTPDNKQPGYLSRFASVEMRLRKHLSLANDDVWQRCADKLIAALGNIPAWHQPLVALLLPEKQDVSHEIARRLCGQKGLYALEWLKLTAADEQVLAELGKYAPKARWQPGERERLAATESARYFSTGSFTERMERKSGRVVLQELGFGDDVWLFRNYILPGKLDAARKSLVGQWHYSPRRVEEINNGWHSTEAKSAEQALRSGDVEALINTWENDSYSHYRQEKSVWNLYLLAQLPREMALTFWLRINEKKHLFAGEDYFLSILGLDTLPGLLLAFSHHPKETFPLILNFGATELALPVARVWRRFAAQRDLARQWILQWPEHTATALIPLVFTKPSDNSEAALLALRLLYEQGHGELLQTVANRWQRTDVWPALEQLLKLGPIEIYPARIPKAPDFWHPGMWSRPRLITNNQPVTDDALEIIGEMLRFTQGGRFYGGLEQLKTFCQPQTLAAFAWDLFTAWQQAGAPAKDNWAFLALSLFGDETTARDLTTQILAWPQEGKSARAVSGLNILTLMNNDMALIQLHHISQRAKSRSLRDNAAEFLQVVAENRGLSQEELADRLVPTLGLDDPQALSFDFGPRQFTVRFDENLNPVIFDQQNVRQKSVPRLRADDDQLKAPEALARLKGLKKDATQVSKNLLPRLEAALRITRRWSLADFHSLFVNHPFTRLVTQRLIWGVYPANEPRRLLNAFRVAAEGEFCNAQDEPIDLPADALIGIAHPLEMAAEMRSEFAQLFADYEIMPPFRQLARRTVLLTPDESASNSLTRWEGKSATVGQLMGMRYKGWESGYEDAFVYDLGAYRLVLKFSPGFNHYNVDSKALMSFRSLRVYRDNKSVTFAELDVFDLSEALSAPDVIFH